jgi:hypothetical protein
MAEKNYFEELYAVNVNDHTEGRNGFTYVSWPFAWAEVKKRFPDSTYTVYENAEGNNYHNDGRTCWVKTGVTVNGIEHIEYLPIMDFRNKSIPYEDVTSFDVNKAIQRSLTKACARHGLGLYIYAGEDLPEAEAEVAKKMAEKITDKDVKVFKAFLDSVGANEENILKAYNHKSLEEFTQGEYTAVKNKINEQRLAKEKEEKAKK